MKKLAVITLAAMMMAACGGGVSLEGQYAATQDRDKYEITFSGNQLTMKINGVEAGGVAIFKIIEQRKEDGGIKGTLLLNGGMYKDTKSEFELKGDKLTIDGLVFTNMNPTPQKTSNSRSIGGGGSGTITMKTKIDYIRLTFEGEGDISIDWGDGKKETKDIDDWIDHNYDENSEHTITITGKNITYLGCLEQQITSLDVSKHTKLIALNCYKNELTSLDVSKNTALESLSCNENELKSLDVSKNTALIYLGCSNNELTSLHMGKNTELSTLYCLDNQITSLDLSKCTALQDLDCGMNQLTSLDLSKCTALRWLHCGGNELTSLDLSKNTALDEVACTLCKLNAPALNALFKTLHGNSGKKTIYIQENPGRFECDRDIAEMKGWTVH